MNHFRLALRRLASTPVLSLAATVSLMLGIGANSLAFGALQGLLLRPLPFTDANRITWVFGRGAADGPAVRGKVSPREASAIAERMTSFSAVAVIGDTSLVLDGLGRPVQWHGIWVTPGLSWVLDITAAAGRPFDATDMRASGPPALMLGYERWVQDFAADPAVIGRVISFADNKRFTVVGVLPQGLEFPLARPPESGNGSGFTPGLQDYWVLGQDDPREYPGGALLARIRDGVSRDGAAAEARTLAAALAGETSDAAGDRTFALVSLRDHLLGALAPTLPLVQAFAGLVLIVAVVNLANLMFVRAIALERDGAIRLALGASRSQLTAGLLAESAVLCLTGLVSGLVLAWTAQQWLTNAASAYPAIAERLEMSKSVLAFAVALCGAIMILAALGPAAARARLPPAVLLGRSDSRQVTPRSARWRNGLVVTQVALTLVLVIGASVLRQSVTRLMSVEMGYQREHVVTADLLLYVPGPAVRAFFRELHPRLRALPGVEAAGLIQSTPLTGKWTFDEPLAIEGREIDAAPPVAGNFVAFDYFAAMGIPIVAGRTFTERDLDSPSPAVVIINDIAARRFFPGEHPIGQRVILAGRPREIVGVVKGTRDVVVEAPAVPQFYQPGVFGGSQLVVRVHGDPARFVDILRTELLAADPRLMVKDVVPLDALVAQHLFERRVISQLLAAFAGIALILSTAGLYGVTHVAAAERRHELGLRIALGARRFDLVRMVLRQGLLVTARGVALGIAAALAGASVLRHLLFETSPTDPMTLGAASVLVVLVSAAACLVPAWNAAAADPAETLRRH